MAEMMTNSKGRRDKKNKPAKRILRVDFTPMVDMNMLLITFFMFCTTLSMPQVMDVIMPARTDIDKQPPNTPNSRAITFILGEQDKVYYYAGLPDYKNYASLKQTDYAGLRTVLLERNASSVNKIKELKLKHWSKQISDKQLKDGISEVKKSKEGMIVSIKPTADACFKNLVDALDEMQICGIGRYAIVDMAEGDKFLVDNYKAKGALTAEAR